MITEKERGETMRFRKYLVRSWFSWSIVFMGILA